jgi:hypothetical protein
MSVRGYDNIIGRRCSNEHGKKLAGSPRTKCVISVRGHDNIIGRRCSTEHRKKLTGSPRTK